MTLKQQNHGISQNLREFLAQAPLGRRDRRFIGIEAERVCAARPFAKDGREKLTITYRRIDNVRDTFTKLAIFDDGIGHKRREPWWRIVRAGCLSRRLSRFPNIPRDSMILLLELHARTLPCARAFTQ